MKKTGKKTTMNRIGSQLKNQLELKIHVRYKPMTRDPLGWV
jgi:hypothetical protein